MELLIITVYDEKACVDLKNTARFVIRETWQDLTAWDMDNLRSDYGDI